jgi:hypothetical protein
MCEYSLWINLNGLKYHIVCDLSVIVCTICIILLIGREKI